jgi:hypothetical protein
VTSEFAKAMIANDEKEKIYWLNLSEKFELIIDIYESSSKAGFDKDTLRIVADAYQISEKNEKAFNVLWQIGDFEKSISVFRRLSSKLSKDDVEKMFSHKYKILLSNNHIELAYSWYKEVEKQLGEKNRAEYAGMYVAKLLQANRWSDAVQLLNQGKSRRSVKVSGDESFRIHRHMVGEIASSEAILGASKKEKELVAKYLSEVIKLGYLEWSVWISIESLGAAIEKTSTFIQALEFYEDLEKEQISQEQVTFIRQRWLKVKNKQLENIKDDMNKTESRPNERLARTWTNRKKEMDEKLMTWSFDKKSIKSISDYPVAQKNEEDGIAAITQIDWQTPICKISIGRDVEILVNVMDGSLITFPADAVISKSQKEAVIFHSEKQPLRGEILPGKYIRIYINDKLQRECQIGS